MSVTGVRQQVFDWLKAHDVNAAVVIAVMVAVAFFNMASALLILVLERTRMIGLLKAMGMENRRIRRIFLYRAAFIVGARPVVGQSGGGFAVLVPGAFPPAPARPGGIHALGGSRGGERGVVAGSRRRGGGRDPRAVARPDGVRGPYPPLTKR